MFVRAYEVKDYVIFESYIPWPKLSILICQPSSTISIVNIQNSVSATWQCWKEGICIILASNYD